jgi:TonB family protein
MKSAKVLFTVNDKGEVDEVIVLKSSDDEKTDQLMKQAISKMPKWRPAENAKGVKVKQYFEFTAGNYGC